MTDPHTALMFIDTQIRTLRYMLPLTTRMWTSPPSRKRSTSCSPICTGSGRISGLADRTPGRRACRGRACAIRRRVAAHHAGKFPQHQQLWDSMTRNYLAASSAASSPPAQPAAAQSDPSWGCTAVFRRPSVHLLRQAMYTHRRPLRPHQCPDGHQWY
jgi:hypothetical protein